MLLITYLHAYVHTNKDNDNDNDNDLDEDNENDNDNDKDEVKTELGCEWVAYWSSLQGMSSPAHWVVLTAHWVVLTAQLLTTQYSPLSQRGEDGLQSVGSAETDIYVWSQSNVLQRVPSQRYLG